MRSGAQVAGALALDAFLGEPPERLHPTVWMGRAVSAFEKRAFAVKSPIGQRAVGVVLAVALPVASFILARTATRLGPRRLRWALEALLISTTLSMRGLGGAARSVERELERGDLPAARDRVGEMVGRDTAGLSPEGVARAAVESVAENTGDGVVAPMLYASLLGAPGALAYKAVNTLDSMVGYRDPPYEDLGWASARLDDLANLLPSRATALAAAAVSGRPATVMTTAWHHGPRTASPNAGWAEAAFAGALGLRLGGANSYGGIVREGPVLGDGRPPVPRDIRRSVMLMRRSCLLLAGALAVVVFPAGGIRRG